MYLKNLLYFSDYKMHFYPSKSGRKMEMHHLVWMQLTSLTGGTGGALVEQGFSFLFSSSKT